MMDDKLALLYMRESDGQVIGKVLDCDTDCGVTCGIACKVACDVGCVACEMCVSSLKLMT